MKILEKIYSSNIPFSWFNLGNYKSSIAMNVEIYLEEGKYNADDFKELFFNLFSKTKDNFVIYNYTWGEGYDVDIESDDVYEMKKLLHLRNSYFKMLNDSEIEPEYEGLCRCIDWNAFLDIMKGCFVTGLGSILPLLIFDEKNQFVFYFHYSGSIGLYYKVKNSAIEEILNLAQKNKYDIRDYD